MTRAQLVAILEKHRVSTDDCTFDCCNRVPQSHHGLLTDLLALQPSREALEKIILSWQGNIIFEQEGHIISVMAKRLDALMAWATGEPPPPTWCKDIAYQAEGNFYYYLRDDRPLRPDAKFCELCGTPRPGA